MTFLRSCGPKTPCKPHGPWFSDKTRKITVFDWKTTIFGILTKNPYQTLWKMPEMSVFDCPVHHRTPPTGRVSKLSETPYQSPWKVPKLSKIHEISTILDTFSGVRFVGDILNIFVFFRVFRWNFMKITTFRVFPLGNLTPPKTWKTDKNQRCPENDQKTPKITKKWQKWTFCISIWCLGRLF